jgi:hypothetical protein
MRALLAAAVLLASPAAAQFVVPQPDCGPADKAIAMLEGLYHETFTTFGIGKRGKEFTALYVSPGGKTFTVLTVDADGIACIAASGGDWSGPNVFPRQGEPM